MFVFETLTSLEGSVYTLFYCVVDAFHFVVFFTGTVGGYFLWAMRLLFLLCGMTLKGVYEGFF